MTTKYEQFPLTHNRAEGSFGPCLLAIGLFLTVCGSLRVSDGVGFGELLLLMLALVGWFKGQRVVLLNSPFTWFWCLLAILMGLGYAFNELLGNWVRRDTVAYLYTGTVTLGLLLLLRGWSDSQFRTLWRVLFAVSLTVLWFGFVVYISGDTDWISALRMDDQGDVRYTAWSTNANQLALFFVPLPIWLLALRPVNGSRFRYVGWLLVTLSTMLMGLIVRSDALALSWGLGIFVLMALDWIWGKRRELKFLGLLAMLAILALVLAKSLTSGDVRTTFKCSMTSVIHLENPVTKGCIAQGSFSGVESFRTGYAAPGYKTEIRLGLWRNAVTVIADSPWVGHGPGAFSWYADSAYQASEEANGKFREEAHNIPLDLMTQGGVFLGLAWCALLGWLLLGAWRIRSSYVFTWVFMLGFFTLFMYHLRHPYLWVALILAAEFIRRRLYAMSTERAGGT